MHSKTKIALLSYDQRQQLLTVSVDKDPNDTLGILIDNGTHASGHFVETPFGWLYTQGLAPPSPPWGLPDLGYGTHQIVVRKKDLAGNTSNVASILIVGEPPGTLGTRPFSDVATCQRNMLPPLWDAGFHDEQNLLFGLAIACGEGGLYPKARNWLPHLGFRPVGTVLGVKGPASAWNLDHTEQGHADRGTFQINSQAHPQFTDEQCDDIPVACRSIYTITGGGQDWRAWGFGAGGSYYSNFFDQNFNGYLACRPLVQEFLATKV